MPRGFVYPQTALDLFEWWVSEFCKAGDEKRGGTWWQSRLQVNGPFTRSPKNHYIALLELKRLARPVEYGGFGQLDVMCNIITEERVRIHGEIRDTNAAARLNFAQYLARKRVEHLRGSPREALRYAECDFVMDLREDANILSTLSYQYNPLELEGGSSGTSLSSESGSYPSSMISD